MDHQVKVKFDEAEGLLEKAKEELCKPEEDVVPYVICKSAYLSVMDYLSSFLLYHESKLPQEPTMEELLKNCRDMDGRFKDLHLSPLYNPTQTEHAWMNMDAAKDFLDMAERTREIVMRPNDRT